MCLEIPGPCSKQRTSHCGQLQLARAIVWGDLDAHTLAYSDGSVWQGLAAAAAVLVGASLGLDPLLELGPALKRCALLCDSRVAPGADLGGRPTLTPGAGRAGPGGAAG